jgi:FKBP-type peptidyl-prolyl cis-trans isomerase FkpA
VKLSGPRRPAFLVVAAIVLAAIVAGCDNTPVTPSSPGYTQTDLRVGTGTEAASGSTVTVTYTGWFYDINKSDKKGLVFDTTAGRDPLTVTLGVGAVISGWDQGLPGMKVGGARRLILPPSYAYGPSRYASIPPNATLIFDIELVGVGPTVKAVDPASGTTDGGTSVTITGTGFISGVTVTFGGTAATNVTVISSTSLTATTPPSAAGAVAVAATNPDGLSGTLLGGYTYVAPTSAARPSSKR